MIAALFSAAVSTPAFADSSNDLADAGLIFEMDNSQSVELAVLSSEEMKSTQGELFTFACNSWFGCIKCLVVSWNKLLQIWTDWFKLCAALAAGAGMIGGLHGSGLAAASGLTGVSRIYVTGRGAGVGASLNL